MAFLIYVVFASAWNLIKIALRTMRYVIVFTAIALMLIVDIVNAFINRRMRSST